MHTNHIGKSAHFWMRQKFLKALASFVTTFFHDDSQDTSVSIHSVSQSEIFVTLENLTR